MKAKNEHLNVVTRLLEDTEDVEHDYAEAYAKSNWVPEPDNPVHVDNLSSVRLLALQGFRDFCGNDDMDSIREALADGRPVWRELPNGDLLFVHVSHHGFDRTTIPADMDVRAEFDWISERDWERMQGDFDHQFDSLELGEKISDLVDRYGDLEIFGESYYDFVIRGVCHTPRIRDVVVSDGRGYSETVVAEGANDAEILEDAVEMITISVNRGERDGIDLSTLKAELA